MFDEKLKILENKNITQVLYKLTLSSSRIARVVKPGQFLLLKISDTFDPLLRRPFSIFGLGQAQIEILYQVLGKGTALLAQKGKGEFLQALGPLGQSFSLRKKERKNILIAGGVGVAPLVFLAKRINFYKFIIGDKNKKEILPQCEIKLPPTKLIFTTDDGSLGQKGFASQALEELLSKEKDKSNLYLFVCGPRAMLKSIWRLAQKYNLEGEASLDERMACGLGACLGCMVKTQEGYKSVCQEGPVFKLKDLFF